MKRPLLLLLLLASSGCSAPYMAYGPPLTLRAAFQDDGLHALEHAVGEKEPVLDPGDLESGRYRVIARAVDSTKMRGEKFPWVLKDEAGLLESERGWWVRIP